MILLLGMLLLAQAHEMPPVRENASEQEKCRDTCRAKHCDSWLSCNRLEDATEREKCKDRTTEDETRCRKVCGESRI